MRMTFPLHTFCDNVFLWLAQDGISVSFRIIVSGVKSGVECLVLLV